MEARLEASWAYWLFTVQAKPRLPLASELSLESLQAPALFSSESISLVNRLSKQSMQTSFV